MSRAGEKRQRLRSALEADRPLVLIGAHDAMSAVLAERAGFEAIWVSGLGVSTMAHALPDLNLITLSEALAAAIRIDEATSLPVLADCDNGYGALVNVVRTARSYDRAGIAGICIEDNEFPKRNSLYADVDAGRALVPLREQARRLAAAKRAQESPEFVLVARVESLIARLGVADACDRARAYAAAGADALLVHSRDRTLGEIRRFLEAWSRERSPVPLVCVPTLFPDFTPEQLHELGFQVVIWANHLMRASVQAMEQTLELLRKERRPAAADATITSVDHVFELVNTRETSALEEEE